MKYFFFLFCILGLSAGAQQKIELKIWPDGAPQSNGLQGPETGHEKGRITNISEPGLMVYLPEESKGAAVIICTGGGYGFVTLPKEMSQMAEMFNELGIVAIFLKYRLPNGNPDIPFKDLEQSMLIVQQYATVWKIQLHRIGVMGLSAGGHMAATLSTKFEEKTRPAFQILLYPLITMDNDHTHEGSRKKLMGAHQSDSLIHYYSADKHVKSNSPPAFIVCSGNDKTISPLNSILYYTALKKHAVPAEMHVYPDGGHGWAFNKQFDYSQDWMQSLSGWIQKFVLE